MLFMSSQMLKKPTSFMVCVHVFSPLLVLRVLFIIIIIIILFSLGFLYLLIERRCEFRTFGSRVCAYVFQRACPFMLFSWI